MIIPFGLSPARLYIYAGIAVIFAAVLTFAGCEHSNAKSLRAEKATLKQNVETFASANKTNLHTISILKASNATWKKLATPAEAMRKAAALAADLELQNAALNAKLDKLSEKDYAKPECVNVLDMPFESLCPNIATGLRDRASRPVHRSD